MNDLAQQIRDRLDAPVPGLSPVAAVFCGIEPGPSHKQMRAALLAVVEYATPGEPHPGERDSRDHAEKAIDAEVEAQLATMLGIIAEKLGIEVSDA